MPENADVSRKRGGQKQDGVLIIGTLVDVEAGAKGACTGFEKHAEILRLPNEAKRVL